MNMTQDKYSIENYNYDLPKELIAQVPSQKRENCRMMVLDRAAQSIEHKHFYDITDYFDENDVIVLNNTKVIPARLFGRKDTGAHIEVFLLKQISDKVWEVLINPSKRVKEETLIDISPDLYVKVLTRQNEGKWLVELHYDGDFYSILDKVGNIPLPPYIERTMTDEQLKHLDYDRYQTVYAQKEGSVAAPTAGLHFTQEILEKLKNKGVQICNVTLNVGLGTFRPVKVENILEHKMDSEEFEICAKTAKIITEAKKQGKKITAVGTTSVRTLSINSNVSSFPMQSVFSSSP